MEDVMILGGFHELKFDFVTDNFGPTLCYYQQQWHMDLDP
jgi:hypothetical protein